jgi:enoyl-CoA hydratase/carnithine racemase
VTVEYSVKDRVATVRLNRPEVFNALDRPTLESLRDSFRAASADHSVGVVVLTGTGEKAFCTGADLDEQQAFLARPNDYWDWMGRFIEAIESIKDCAKPVVARLNGMVVGGGNELNIACDLAVAADDITLKHVGPARGSLPSGGATQWMPLLVGDRRAREIILLDRPVSAQQAVEWGWINRAVPRAELDDAVADYCQELLEKMPEIVRATRVQLNLWKNLSWGMSIHMAREWLTVHAASAEVAEGLASFHEKRPPNYEKLRTDIEEAGK